MSKKNKNKRHNSSVSVIRTYSLSIRWTYIFLFVFAVLLYSNTFFHDFAFDDSVVITGNKYTKQGTDGIRDLVTKDLFSGIYGTALDLEGGRWRPLTLAMFAIEYELFGENAIPYHIINVLLYGITALVLFMTLLRIFNSHQLVFLNQKIPIGQILAFVTTLLFIAHPIHTEVVANIKSRDEIVSFLFLCISLYFLFRYVLPSNKENNPKYLLVCSALSYFTALLSKENGITFLAVIPIALFLFAQKSIRQSLILTLPFLLMAGIYLVVRTSLVGMIGDRVSDDLTDNPFLKVNFPDLPTPLPFLEKFATICWILLKYILILVFPHPLTSDYAFNEIPAITLANPKAIVSILIHGGLLFYAIKFLIREMNYRKNSTAASQNPFALIFAFAILFHVITISIVSNLFFLIGTNMGERFVYITSLGFCLALAASLVKIFKWDSSIINHPSSFLRAYPLFLILIPYSFKTLTRNSDWKNNETLFTADVKTSTNSANAHYYYANTIFTSHMNDEPSPKRDSIFALAEKEFKRAIEINPYFHYCYYNIGLIWEKLGVPDSAIAWHIKVIQLKPENTMAQHMAKGALGLVYGKLKGDIDKAIPLLKEAIAWKPDDPGYHENLGICYAMKGNYDASIREFETALGLKKELKKEDARVFMNLALSWMNKKDKKKYDEYLQKAFQLDPSLKK